MAHFAIVSPTMAVVGIRTDGIALLLEIVDGVIAVHAAGPVHALLAVVVARQAEEGLRVVAPEAVRNAVVEGGQLPHGVFLDQLVNGARQTRVVAPSAASQAGGVAREATLGLRILVVRAAALLHADSLLQQEGRVAEGARCLGSALGAVRQQLGTGHARVIYFHVCGVGARVAHVGAIWQQEEETKIIRIS